MPLLLHSVTSPQGFCALQELREQADSVRKGRPGESKWSTGTVKCLCMCAVKRHPFC